MRIFNLDQGCRCKMYIITRTDLIFDFSRVQNAILTVYRTDLNTGKKPRSASLKIINMSTAITNNFCARLRMDFDGDLITHGTTWYKQAGFFAEHFGNFVLELNNAGVITQNIISHFCFYHSVQHFLTGFGYCITSKIYHLGLPL